MHSTESKYLAIQFCLCFWLAMQRRVWLYSTQRSNSLLNEDTWNKWFHNPVQSLGWEYYHYKCGWRIWSSWSQSQHSPGAQDTAICLEWWCPDMLLAVEEHSPCHWVMTEQLGFQQLCHMEKTLLKWSYSRPGHSNQSHHSTEHGQPVQCDCQWPQYWAGTWLPV